mmetsp:Transcript_37799/g.55676  ORF Transcript_37799/g.55676 Transcript_37799/m.55676 type:complete len:306 (+) Transcript_37799:73-990(+)|eukprot:CAMPEP_0195520866 /NCGR_PEP_ID=MMETSP0794_2-20130614/17591_1 /TAXON_ID=515487 /ORGANISM="Stephanopyxis turris, Strain CCMP 815" /LENGTH=305 /DNA_ID=CAMNT_0040650301 /DNA_START=68 /DNA_END=985 /DNA_ORIENTATION=-
MPVERANTDLLSPVTIIHSSGAKAVVHPFGATVTSFQTSAGRELLFVSSLAKLDGSKAIRGGIPLAFPQFGQPDKSMPQHGFLRCNTWKVGNEFEAENGASCCEFTLSLADVVKARGGKWDFSGDLDCEVTLTVKVEAEKMTNVLTMKNTGETEFDFQALFHTYYKIEGAKALEKEACNVGGLTGYSVEDKVTGEDYVLNDDEPVFVEGEVDRIYSNPSKPDLEVIIGTGEGIKTGLKASASVDGTKTSVSAVVWNPFIEKAKALGDFADEQYHEMICVEPGILKNVPVLGAGKEAVFEQVITAM